MPRFPVVSHTSLYVNGSFHVDTAAHTPRFDVSAEAVAHLKREGYVVIKAVANASEVARARELFWNFFEGTGQGVSRHDPTSWVANGPNQYGANTWA